MQIFTGTVIAANNPQTVTVLVRRRFMHPLYKKAVSRSKKYQVHDPIGVQVGERVRFTPSRPYSKTKRWVIVEKVKSAQPSAKH